VMFVALEVLERVNQELGTTTAVITRNTAIAAMADRLIRSEWDEKLESLCNGRRR
jgi:putative ABC transport system ATP-binding protein